MTRRHDGAGDPVDEAVARALDQIELEDPPEDLKPNVLRAIGTRPEPARSGWFETLRAGLSRPFFAQAYPFAAGAAIGAVAFAVLSHSGIRWSSTMGDVSGAMVPGASTSLRVDEQQFQLGRATVGFEVSRKGGTATVVVRSESPEPASITLQLPPGARVERFTAVPSASGGADYGPGWVRFRQTGRNRTEIGLTMESGAGDAPIHVGIASSEGIVRGALRVRNTAP